MDINRILAELQEEHQHLDLAILAIERLAVSARRRGRPPGVDAGRYRTKTPRGRPPGSKNKPRANAQTSA